MNLATTDISFQLFIPPVILSVINSVLGGGGFLESCRRFFGKPQTFLIKPVTHKSTMTADSGPTVDIVKKYFLSIYWHQINELVVTSLAVSCENGDCENRVFFLGKAVILIAIFFDVGRQNVGRPSLSAASVSRVIGALDTASLQWSTTWVIVTTLWNLVSHQLTQTRRSRWHVPCNRQRFKK